MKSRRFTSAALFFILISGGVGHAAPPAWWAEGPMPVIDPTATPNNLGVANIGQAKWMVKRALAALQQVDVGTAAAIESDLTLSGIVIASWVSPSTPEEIAAQRSPLVVGQLKAMAAPFYTRLNTKDANWLLGERTQNGTAVPGSYFPWTVETADDSNKSVATIGQLKAVFSLRFETLPIGEDEDGDGVVDSEDADPENGSVGRLSVSITSPVSGVIVR